MPSGAQTTFVSSHFELDPHELSRVVAAHGMITKDVGEHLLVKECPICKRPTRGRPDNFWKLYLLKASGAYFCHRCGAGGSWFDLKRALNGKPAVQPPPEPDTGHVGRATDGPGARLGTVAGVMDASRALLDEGRFPSVLEFLTERRGLSEDVLRAYAVGGASWQFFDGPAGAPPPSAPAVMPAMLPGGMVAAPRSAPRAAPQAAEGFVSHACVVLPWGESEAGALAAAKAEADALSRGVGDGSASSAAASAAWAGHHPALGAAARGGRAPAPSEVLAAVSRVKLRSVLDKRHQAMAPRGGGWGLFGAHTVPQSVQAVVVTEGEFDALAVHQATGAHAVSLPNGARSLPVQLLPWFERFQRLYLWMDEDGPGWEGAQMMARKLGIARSCLVRTSDGAPHVPAVHGGVTPAAAPAAPGAGVVPASSALARPKDANDALRAGHDLASSLLSARPLPHSQVVSFRDLRAAVVHEVTDREALSGDPLRVLPQLQALTKGHRRGELTVLTGPTGAGKTTLLSQLSVDLAAQGVPTLWGSFEVKATRLLRVMMHQFLGRSIDGAPRDEVEAAADAFEVLPIQFMRHFGPTSVDDVLDAMQYSAYAHDTAHVVLDNLQFMMSGQTRGPDRFEAQEEAIHKFRAFASEANVHVTLVIHPRKERDGESLAMHSVFGSAKATQEADTVLILQNVNGSKAVDVRKNRFDGGTGSVPLVFDPASLMYREKGAEPLRGGIAALGAVRSRDGDEAFAAARAPLVTAREDARAALRSLGLVGSGQAASAAATAGGSGPAEGKAAPPVVKAGKGAAVEQAPVSGPAMTAEKREAVDAATPDAAPEPALEPAPKAGAVTSSGHSAPDVDRSMAGRAPATNPPAAGGAAEKAAPQAEAQAPPKAASPAPPAATPATAAPSKPSPSRMPVSHSPAALAGASHAVASAAAAKPLPAPPGMDLADDEVLFEMQDPTKPGSPAAEWPEEDILIG